MGKITVNLSKKQHNKEVDKVIKELKELKAEIAKEHWLIRFRFWGKVEALIRRTNATRR